MAHVADGKAVHRVRCPCPLPSFSPFPSHEQTLYPSRQALRQTLPRDTHIHTQPGMHLSETSKGVGVKWGGAAIGFQNRETEAEAKGERTMDGGR